MLFLLLSLQRLVGWLTGWMDGWLDVFVSKNSLALITQPLPSTHELPKHPANDCFLSYRFVSFQQHRTNFLLIRDDEDDDFQRRRFVCVRFVLLLLAAAVAVFRIASRSLA